MSEKQECSRCQELEKFLSDAHRITNEVSKMRDENHNALMILTKKASVSDAQADHWRRCSDEYMDKCRDLENKLYEIREGAIESAKIKELEKIIVKMATSAYGGKK